MTWFWPAVGVIAILLVALAWLTDVHAKRTGHPNRSPADISSNLKEAKRRVRSRLPLFRRMWNPADEAPQKGQSWPQ